jgi:hypothetical protein
MATPSNAPSDARRTAVSWRFSILVPIAIFALSRLYVALLMIVASRNQIGLPAGGLLDEIFIYTVSPAQPGYLTVTENWDGQWYKFIATEGYQPAGSSREDAAAARWAWAFPPVYPLVTGRIMTMTGLPFAVVSTVVNFCAGAGAMILLFRVVAKNGGRWFATWGVVLACCFISAPLFQMAYSESLALLLLMAVILLAGERKYWWAVLPTVLLAFTRLITPVLFVVVVVSMLLRVRDGGWRSVPLQELAGSVVLAITCVLGGFAWPTLASALMGDAGRFNRGTEMASSFGWGWFGALRESVGWGGVGLLCIMLLVIAFFALRRGSRAWGTELRVWSLAYPFFILAVTPITGGILRYALLAPTLALACIPDGRKTVGQRFPPWMWLSFLALFGLCSQWLYVRHMIVIDAEPFMP